MTRVARDAGVTREALYKVPTPEGDPKFSTFMGVIKALGLRLTVSPVDTKPKGGVHPAAGYKAGNPAKRPKNQGAAVAAGPVAPSWRTGISNTV